LGIPARITSSGHDPNSYKELVAEIAQLRRLLEANTAELRELSSRLAEREARLSERDERIAELERLLDESRRSGKRQAAPFSKGNPVEEPAKPGRKRGDAHGRHGHRMAPVGPLDRELSAAPPPCCPDCGGDLDLERTAEQF
jgi:septal ring factor EnvC (AmiA/AmiB activator)